MGLGDLTEAYKVLHFLFGLWGFPSTPSQDIPHTTDVSTQHSCLLDKNEELVHHKENPECTSKHDWEFSWIWPFLLPAQLVPQLLLTSYSSCWTHQNIKGNITFFPVLCYLSDLFTPSSSILDELKLIWFLLGTLLRITLSHWHTHIHTQVKKGRNNYLNLLWVPTPTISVC